jgi:hypothetical protein
MRPMGPEGAAAVIRAKVLPLILSGDHSMGADAVESPGKEPAGQQW